MVVTWIVKLHYLTKVQIIGIYRENGRRETVGQRTCGFICEFEVYIRKRQSITPQAGEHLMLLLGVDTLASAAKMSHPSFIRFYFGQIFT